MRWVPVFFKLACTGVEPHGESERGRGPLNGRINGRSLSSPRRWWRGEGEQSRSAAKGAAFEHACTVGVHPCCSASTAEQRVETLPTYCLLCSLLTTYSVVFVSSTGSLLVQEMREWTGTVTVTVRDTPWVLSRLWYDEAAAVCF